MFKYTFGYSNELSGEIIKGNGHYKAKQVIFRWYVTCRLFVNDTSV